MRALRGTSVPFGVRLNQSMLHTAHPKFLCIQLLVLFLDDFDSNHKCMMMLSTDIITRLSSDDTGCIYAV